MKCPMSEERVDIEMCSHVRFAQWFDSDEVVDILFTEITKLDDRVTNLCELLEIRER